MEFLKKMKSRETFEMTLKTIASVVVGLILIFLMEGMIFGIYMNKINDNKFNSGTISKCVAYCEEVDDNEFKVYLHNTETGSWHVENLTLSEETLKSREEAKVYHDVEWRAPNPFDVSINGVHYVVMAGVIVAIIGLYGWRFYKLDREYKGFEKKFKKTGKIFA